MFRARADRHALFHVRAFAHLHPDGPDAAQH
jgi:hypothetical protein